MTREKEQAVAELRAQVADIAIEAASRIVKSSLSEDAQRKLVDDYIKELPRALEEGRGVSEIAKVFKGLPQAIPQGSVKAERTYYFSLGDHEKWTVHIGKDKCTVRKGKNEDADCFFKSSPALFLDVWSGKHQLGATDFLTGRVKSNNPLLLKEFVAAFERSK